MTEELAHSELLTLRAAAGWLELDLPKEALAELDQLPSAAQKCAGALEMRWMILAQMRDWDEAMPVSRRLIERAPDCASSWLHHAYATRRATAGGLAEAFRILAAVASQFPQEPVIPYNLACYACQLQRDGAETMDWLERALRVGEPKALIQMALEDADLAPMHAIIADLAKKRGWMKKN